MVDSRTVSNVRPNAVLEYPDGTAMQLQNRNYSIVDVAAQTWAFFFLRCNINSNRSSKHTADREKKLQFCILLNFPPYIHLIRSIYVLAVVLYFLFLCLKQVKNIMNNAFFF